MYRSRLIPEFGLVVVTYSEPFVPEDLIDKAKSLPPPDPNRGGHKCILADFRAVNVNRISGVDSRRYALARSARILPLRAEPIAILVSREEDFAIFRMHNQWVEAFGLRSEEDAFVALELRTALKWLAARTAQPDLQYAVLPESTAPQNRAR